jgi:hypothetical protein
MLQPAAMLLFPVPPAGEATLTMQVFLRPCTGRPLPVFAE